METVNVAVAQIIALRKEVEETSEIEASYVLVMAGLRGVTRELLADLRKSDPSNPLLEKKYRDRVFDAAYKVQLANNQGTNTAIRYEKAPEYRDAAYGAPGSNKGGPEKQQITSYAAVRAAAEVPAHVTEREQFLGLIAKLRDEVERLNPNSPILQEKAILDVDLKR
jgi:hypothetical protein